MRQKVLGANIHETEGLLERKIAESEQQSRGFRHKESMYERPNYRVIILTGLLRDLTFIRENHNNARAQALDCVPARRHVALRSTCRALAHTYKETRESPVTHTHSPSLPLAVSLRLGSLSVMRAGPCQTSCSSAHRTTTSNSLFCCLFLSLFSFCITRWSQGAEL